MSAPVSTIAEIGKHEGQAVTIRGWLYNLRESGKLLFPIFRDGSGVIQGVVPKSAVSPEIFEAVKGLKDIFQLLRCYADPGFVNLDANARTMATASQNNLPALLSEFHSVAHEVIHDAS